MNNENSDARRLKLWHEFQAGSPPGTELLSYDQREDNPWSFYTRRKNQRYGDTPLFAPTPEDRDRLKGYKVDFDENSVIGGHFITCEGDWKIKSMGGNAVSPDDSTQTIKSLGGYTYSYGDSTQNIESVDGSAMSRDTSPTNPPSYSHRFTTL